MSDASKSVFGEFDPKSFIYIGQSFFLWNNALQEHFLRIARAAHPDRSKEFRATSAILSGSGLSWHDVESYFRGNVASFTFVGNEVVFQKPARLFDLAIMADGSVGPIHPQLKDLFHEYVAKHCAVIRRHGARPALFMTWAYQDKPEMTDQLAEQYTIAGKANDALVIPAGLAFAHALRKDARIVLHDKDKRHPSLLGTYLGAATVYSAVFGRMAPADSPLDGVPAETVSFLNEAAWETVQTYRRAPSRAA